LRNDLGARKENDSLIPDVSAVGDREQREAVLLIAIGQPLPVLSRRFLIGRAEAAKLRSAITSRYPALFRWLQEFRGSALAVASRSIEAGASTSLVYAAQISTSATELCGRQSAGLQLIRPVMVECSMTNLAHSGSPKCAVRSRLWLILTEVRRSNPLTDSSSIRVSICVHA
jgi:hypothetical protein